MNIYPAFVSKHNFNHESQITLLMILNGEGWYYLAVTKLSALLAGTTSKNRDDFHCLNYLHSFRTINVNYIKKQLKIMIFGVL